MGGGEGAKLVYLWKSRNKFKSRPALIDILRYVKNFIAIRIHSVCLIIANKNMEIKPEFFPKVIGGLVLYMVSKVRVICSIWAHSHDMGYTDIKEAI